MLIGELVPETLRYLRNNPAAPDCAAFSHILVDEYQDLNTAEQELVQLLAGQAQFTIIGDEDQSIYSFKYAHPEGIAEFHARHPDTAEAGRLQALPDEHRRDHRESSYLEQPPQDESRSDPAGRE